MESCFRYWMHTCIICSLSHPKLGRPQPSILELGSHPKGRAACAREKAAPGQLPSSSFGFDYEGPCKSSTEGFQENVFQCSCNRVNYNGSFGAPRAAGLRDLSFRVM